MMVAMFVRMFMVVSFAVLMFVMMPFAMIMMVLVIMLVVMFHVTFFVSVHMVGAFFTMMGVNMNIEVHPCDAVGIASFNMTMYSFQVHGVNCIFKPFTGCA